MVLLWLLLFMLCVVLDDVVVVVVVVVAVAVVVVVVDVCVCVIVVVVAVGVVVVVATGCAAVVVAVDGSVSRCLVRVHSVWPMHPYDVRLVDWVH